MMELFIEGVGILAPGLENWTEAQKIFTGQTSYRHAELPPVAPAILAPTERRRCIASARLALTVAYEASQMRAAEEPRALACVFASSDGDGQIIHQISDSLAQDPPDVSPIRFSNSVHNAAAGYWSIAAGLKQASTCLCAFDDSFAAGLLEAGVQTVDQYDDVLLTAFDMRFPLPFSDLRPTAIDCAVALLMTRQRSACSLARLEVTLVDKRAATAMPAMLPPLFASNPAARAMPLLAAISAPRDETVYLDYLEQSLAIRVTG